jgi:hypothetical protein
LHQLNSLKFNNLSNKKDRQWERSYTKNKKQERRWLFIVASILSAIHVYVEFSLLGATIIGVLLLIASILLRFYYFSSVSVYRNAATLVLWLYVELSMLVWPVINAVNIYGDYYPDDSILLLHRLGVGCLFIIAIIALLFQKKNKNNKTSIRNRSPWQGLSPNFVKIAWYSFILIAFGITILAYQLGIATLGAENKMVLPFKLTGLLNFFHLYGIRFIFIVFLDIFYSHAEKRGNRQVLNVLLVYLAWNILETIILLSKGQLLIGMIPLLLWTFYRGVFRFHWIIYISISVLLLSMIFPTMSTYRGHLHAGHAISFYEAWTIQENLSRSDETFITTQGVRIYERIFSTGKHIVKFLPFLDAPYLTGNLSEVIKYGGSQKYHTRVIDGVPEFVPHSSGATGLSDAFLIGGIPLVVITMALLSLLSVIIVDGNRLQFIFGTAAGQALAAYFLFMLMTGGTWSWAFKGLLPNLVWPSLFIFHAWLRGKALKSLHRK